MFVQYFLLKYFTRLITIATITIYEGLTYLANCFYFTIVTLFL